MVRKLLFHRTMIPSLERGLDAMALRQKAVADNIANTQTPGYRRKIVDFEESLRQANHRFSRERLYQTNPDHLPGMSRATKLTRPQLRQADEKLDGPGSEELVVEREMTTLAQTQLKFEAEVKLAQVRFDMLKMAIRGSR